MKYKSEVFCFKEHVVDIPDGSIVVSYFYEDETETLYGKLPEFESLVVLVPIKEE